MCKEKMVLLEN